MSLVFDHTTLSQRVLFGTGMAVENATSAVDKLGAERVIVIAGSSAAHLVDQVSEHIPVVARVTEVVQHVPAERVEAAVALAEADRVDAVIAIGGGSATGLAKMVALRTGVPIIAMPTTFSGSEATDVWGITEESRKTTGSDPRVLPRIVVYDASLSAGLPATAAVASGLNALAHAVDGFWAPRADPINRAMGTEGMRALVPGLRDLAADGSDVVAREQVLYGAYLAAVAFASAGSAMHHKICHVLGGAYGLPHAEMHSVVLPYVTAFNAAASPDATARILSVTGGTDAGADLWALREDLGVPSSLREIGLDESDLTEGAALVADVIPASNPQPASVGDIERLLRSAWCGERPNIKEEQ